MKQNLLQFVHSELNNKLAGSFGAIILLLAVLSFVFLSSLNTMQNDVYQVINNNALKTHLVSEMRIYTRERQLILLKIIQKPDVFERDNLLTTYYRYGSRFTLARNQFENLMDETENKLFRNVISNIKKVAPAQLEILNLALQQQEKKAKAALDLNVSAIQKRVIQSLDNLYDYQHKNAQFLFKDISIEQNYIKKTTIILSQVILIIAFFIAFSAVQKNKTFFWKLQHSVKAPVYKRIIRSKPVLVHDANKQLNRKNNLHAVRIVEQTQNIK